MFDNCTPLTNISVVITDVSSLFSLTDWLQSPQNDRLKGPKDRIRETIGNIIKNQIQIQYYNCSCIFLQQYVKFPKKYV